MSKKERVTVDLDEECYYLDGEFWTSWDHYGEQMADEINKLLNEQDELIETLKEDVEIILDYVLNKGKFAMTVKEQKAHNRLRGFVRGDME